MTLMYSFIFCGLVCLIGQIILDNTNLTPGHITSIFVVIGAILGCFGWYDIIIEHVGAGANLPIVSFGNNLTNYTYEGFLRNGFLGLFDNMLKGASLGIVATIMISAVITLFTKAKD